MGAPYYVIVEGRRGPKRPQPDLETARSEAHRLYLNHGMTRAVSVLETLEHQPAARQKKQSQSRPGLEAPTP